MDEAAFINSIDNAFPYDNEQEWRSLVIQGSTISDNASFAVLHEICRAPQTIDPTLQYTMVAFWEEHSAHPLSTIVVEAGKAIIQKEDLPLRVALKYMEHIRAYRNLYSALAIIYFSCDGTTGEADIKYNEIVANWQE